MSQGILDNLDFEAMESMIKKKVLHVAARFLEKMPIKDTSDYKGAVTTCIFCGQEARYVNRNAKTFTTALGDITLDRAYYYCPCSAHGF